MARFVVELGGVFAESQHVNILLSKIDKQLEDLAMPRIINNYHSQTTLVQTFTEVELCDRTLCQHNATNMVSYMTNVSKFMKPATTTSGLIEVHLEKKNFALLGV